MFNPCQNRISIESVNRYPVGVRPALITGKDDFDEILKNHRIQYRLEKIFGI